MRKLLEVQFKFGNSMNYKNQKHSSDKNSRTSTSCDSDRQDEPRIIKTNVLKHKTELCKTFSELGYCGYGGKCRFAHGRQELISAPTKEHFRKRKCNGFWKNGCCQYGIRCQFGHSALSWDDSAALLGLQATVEIKSQGQSSRLFSLIGAH